RAVLRATDTLLTDDVGRIAPGLGVPARPAWGRRRRPPKPDAAPSLALRRCANSGVAAAIATHRIMVGLMEWSYTGRWPSVAGRLHLLQLFRQFCQLLE